MPAVVDVVEPWGMAQHGSIQQVYLSPLESMLHSDAAYLRLPLHSNQPAARGSKLADADQSWGTPFMSCIPHAARGGYDSRFPYVFAAKRAAVRHCCRAGAGDQECSYHMLDTDQLRV